MKKERKKEKECHPENHKVIVRDLIFLMTWNQLTDDIRNIERADIAKLIGVTTSNRLASQEVKYRLYLVK